MSNLNFRFFIIFLFFLFFTNCMDTIGYTQTNKEEKESIPPYYWLLGLSSSSTTGTTNPGLQLNFTIPEATGANLFDAVIHNSTGQRIAGISGRLNSSRSYSGVFKQADSNTGRLSNIDAEITSFGPGLYYMGLYVDNDGNETINLADRVYNRITLDYAENGSISSINISEGFVNPIDVQFQYTGVDIESYMHKNVFCYIFTPGVSTSITSAATMNSMLKTHAISLATGIVNAGSFNVTIANTLGLIGTSWSTSHFVRFMPPDFSGSVVCWIDNTANGTADIGEPYFRTNDVKIGTNTVNKIGVFQ